MEAGEPAPGAGRTRPLPTRYDPVYGVVVRSVVKPVPSLTTNGVLASSPTLADTSVRSAAPEVGAGPASAGPAKPTMVAATEPPAANSRKLPLFILFTSLLLDVHKSTTTSR